MSESRHGDRRAWSVSTTRIHDQDVFSQFLTLSLSIQVIHITMNISLCDVIGNIKSGREYALLGNYESSQVYYQGVIQQISKLLTSINDPDRIRQWQEVSLSHFEYNLRTINNPLTFIDKLKIQQLIVTEFEGVRNIQNVLFEFKNDETNFKYSGPRRGSDSLTRSSALSMSMVSIDSSGQPTTYGAAHNNFQWLGKTNDNSPARMSSE